MPDAVTNWIRGSVRASHRPSHTLVIAGHRVEIGPQTVVIGESRTPPSRRSGAELCAITRRGLRAPGLGGSQRLIGTWRAKNDKEYVCVRRGQPVKVTLDGQKYRTVLIGLDDAECVAASVRAAARP
jgi:hypothetical protein